MSGQKSLSGSLFKMHFLIKRQTVLQPGQVSKRLFLLDMNTCFMRALNIYQIRKDFGAKLQFKQKKLELLLTFKRSQRRTKGTFLEVMCMARDD